MIVHGVFHRHPTLRVGSIENGSDWVAHPRQAAAQEGQPDAGRVPGAIRSTCCGATCGSSPYYEEDLRQLADTIGVEQILFGSDWPHGEGLAEPVAVPRRSSAGSPTPTSTRSCAPTTIDFLGDVRVAGLNRGHP